MELFHHILKIIFFVGLFYIKLTTTLSLSGAPSRGILISTLCSLMILRIPAPLLPTIILWTLGSILTSSLMRLSWENIENTKLVFKENIILQNHEKFE